jgi:lipoprotein-releasing system permease protein
VAVATAALVIVLSVFNGFKDLIASFFTAFDPQIEVVPISGKAVAADDPILTKIKLLPEVSVATECVEDQALAMYNGKQAMVNIKGVEDNFDSLTHIRQILYGDGEWGLHAANLEYGVIGIRLASTLGTGARWDGYLHIYAPQREGQLDMMNPQESFVVDSLISPGVVFAVNQAKYDNNYIITSISFARKLFFRQGMITSLELRLKSSGDVPSVKKEIQDIAGKKFKVLDRYEQQSDQFRIMQVEKFIAYIFLTFILIVACFNIISSLSMLIIDKKDDVKTLRNLGASDKQISRVFMFEGRMISVLGALVGIGIGLLLCLLQQQFGLVSMGHSSGNFIVDAYPVSVHYDDIFIIFITVILVGWAAVWYPVKKIKIKD